MPCLFNLKPEDRYCAYCPVYCPDRTIRMEVTAATNTGEPINQQDMNEETISKILEVRRALNEQVISLLYVEVETEEDAKELETLKGQIRGAVGRAEQLAESLIKQSLKG